MSVEHRHYPEAVWLLGEVEEVGVLEGEALAPFAREELLCAHVRETGIPLIHAWRHAGALIIGLRDRALPQAGEALRELRERGTACAVRHSGGACVPLDSGVLNLSVILPKQSGQVRTEDDFRRMADWLEAAVARLAPGARVERGEVAGAYCPGDYDLAIGGRKFCGLAQRRKVHATVVQAFVNVTGSGVERALRAAAFYRRAAGELAAPGSYPVIDAVRTASLSETAGIAGMQAFVSALQAEGGVFAPSVADRAAASLTRDALDRQIRAMRERYDSDIR